MSVEQDRWEQLTRANVLIKREIVAFIAVRADIAALYVFWCNNVGGCPPENKDDFNEKIGEFYATFEKLPMAHELYGESMGAHGMLQYINKDYYEDEAPKNHRHKHNVQSNLQEVWKRMRDMHDEVEKTWKMPERVKTEYAAVRQKAFSSVRAWLKIPSGKGLRRREEGDAMEGRRSHPEADVVTLLRACPR